MQLDIEAAKRAIEQLGKSLDLSMLKTAVGILEIVNENMSNAIKEVTIGKGRDPRDFVLSAFGGAGSLHAVAVAEKVGIPIVVIPPEPGNLCAFGDINMDLHNEVERFFYAQLSTVDIDALNEKFNEMDNEGMNLLKSQNVKTNGEIIKHSLSMRYVGQSYEIEIPCEDMVITSEVAVGLAEAFHETHKKLYFVNDIESDVEITKLRATIVGKIAEDIRIEKTSGSEQTVTPKKVKAFFNDEYVDTPVYQRHNLKVGEELVGPLIIREKKSSTIVPPGKVCVIDSSNHSLIIRSAEL
jgi:N-methylhydantoinase A